MMDDGDVAVETRAYWHQTCVAPPAHQRSNRPECCSSPDAEKWHCDGVQADTVSCKAQKHEHEYAGQFGKVKMRWHRKTLGKKSERHWRLPHSWLTPNVKMVTFFAQWALSSNLQTSKTEKKPSVNKVHIILHSGKDNQLVYFWAYLGLVLTLKNKEGLTSFR